MAGSADTGEHPAETRGRAELAGHLAGWIRRSGIPVERVRSWNEAKWLAAAKAAKVKTALESDKVPSEKTRALVLDYLDDETLTA